MRRLLVTWLLLLVLPVQAMASAGMMRCHARDMGASLGIQHSHAIGHDAHVHDQAGMAIAPVADNEALAVGDSTHAEARSAERCSACVLCIIATAILGSSDSLNLPAPSRLQFLPGTETAAGITTSPLERPPRAARA